MDLLDIRQLRAFQELARKGSFTVAAHSLNLTQSAISHSIKALERSLDLPLFERLGKSVRLTAAGEILLPHADRILFRMERAQEELIALGRPGHGRLRVGATVTISQYVLPSVLRELRESFPSFDISVATDDSKGLIRALEAGEIDVAIAMETPFSEKMRRNFLNENFIIYSQKSETFRLIEQQCARSGIRLKTSLQVGSMAAITEMAKIGMGVGLLSSWVAEEEIAKEQLIFRDLPWDRLSRRWSIHSDPRHESQMIEEVFTGICRVVVDTLVLRTDRFRSPRLPLGSAT